MPDQQPFVFHVVPSLRLGGAERLIVELAARLPQRGYRTKIVALFDAGTLWQEVRDRNIRWTQVAPSVHASRFDLLRQLMVKIYADPGRRPDIVHTHLFGADAWCTLARTLHRASDFLYERGVAQPVFISTAHNIDHEDTSLRRFARRWAVRRMDHVIAISKDVKRYVVNDLRVREPRVSVIPNGIDVREVPEREPGGFRSVPRLIIVGRLEPQKGHETLFRALADVPSPWRLDVVGRGSLERELKELTEELGIASRVHFLGECRDVRERLAASDLFLFPSLWEGMGLALLEAMAAGVPFLASDLPAIREFAPARHLVPAEDVPAWTRAIREALKHPRDLLVSARALSPRTRKKYDINRMVDAYAKVYKRLVES